MNDAPEIERFHTMPRDAERRIERFLSRELDCSKAHVEKLLRQGRVRSGERVFSRGGRLWGGETIEIHPNTSPHPAPLPNRKLPLTVLHVDADVIGIDKPSGMAVQPGPGHGSDTLLNALIARYPELLELGADREYGFAHRLDLGTSGVILVGRSAAGYSGLVEAFKARAVEKEYAAIVIGAPPSDSGELSTDVDGKSALTHYELIESVGALSLLTLRPKTGRKHQLRVHLAELGCPVLGDARHGHGLDEHTAQLYLKRMALHAMSISLLHPGTGDELRLETELPKALRKAWRRAKKRAEPT
jgi:23S rRNA pseudouridine1911/1915/1917 synthase